VGTNTHSYSLFTTCTFIFQKSVQISLISVIRVLIAARFALIPLCAISHQTEVTPSTAGVVLPFIGQFWFMDLGFAVCKHSTVF